MTGGDPNLERFAVAQIDTHRTALTEIHFGAKRGHWMWFIFPQIAKLEPLAMARRYAIGSPDEARAYLAHALLGPRLQICVAALPDLPGSNVGPVLGPIDALKLRTYSRCSSSGTGAPVRRNRSSNT